MGRGRRRGMRAVPLFLVLLVLVFMAVARVAAAEGSDVAEGVDVGGGEGEDKAFEKRFLKLWTDGGGGDGEDHLRCYGDDEDDYGDIYDDEKVKEMTEEEEEGEDGIMLGATRCPNPNKKKKKKKRNVVKVDSFGAVGDGCADDTEAFAKAWEKACSLKDAVLVVTAGRRYKVGPSRFMGPCKERLVVLIHGTIVAPEEPSEWNPKSPRLWLLFGGLVGARIQGGGVIDGSGSKWTPCANQTTNVAVSNVMYRNISGTSTRDEAIKFACSDAVPCSDIVLSNVNLLGDDGAEVQAVCNCAMGLGYDPVRPAVDCLRNNACGSGGGGLKLGAEEPSTTVAPLHTEL
ncbi:unnamed protein product [Triticum turgidum subsp. durum]|uniref:Polygalacturonase n=1 Tax=Triticum turgidum subsp. durum TaxID=4567 RepID=A0A9R1B7Q5_TRITD|nr:unnamed protein product [Triticum turgidum subsp. durum]